MRRLAPTIAVLALALVATACLPANPGPTGLYLGKQADIHPVVTPEMRPVTWGHAPPIDDDYGGTLYDGTTLEQQDPRPALRADGDQPLRLWVADPNNGVEDRPAIIWLHGGGFAVGVDSMYDLANGTGRAWAERGYVSISVEYRINTHLVGQPGGGTGRPPSVCQWTHDHQDQQDAEWEALRDECENNIVSAQRDVQGAVRWIRRHAAELGVDPDKIAVGGFSAGAAISARMAYLSEDVGTHRYTSADNLSVKSSRVQAALLASGCLPSLEGEQLPDIGAGDAPISAIHSEFDQAAPYECIARTVTTARNRGLVAELTSYCKAAGHANVLYRQHLEDTDEQWSTFLARELKLYRGMRPPSADPLCP